jgi:hypothetical protein
MMSLIDMELWRLEAQGEEGKKPRIDPAIIEELMKGYQRPQDLTGPGGSWSN